MPVARERYPGEFLFRVSRDPLTVLVDLSRRYGDIVRVPIGPQTFVLVAHPELAREVLVTQQRNFVRGYAHRGLSLLLGEGLLTSQGDFHRHQRRLAQPAFHSERIHRYAAVMAAAGRRWDARWSRREGEVVDMHEEMMALTLGIVGETLLGARMESRTREVVNALSDMLAWGPLTVLPFGDSILRSPLPFARRFRRARAQLDRVVSQLINERRSLDGTVDDRGDLLSMLMMATDPEETGGEPMSSGQLRDEVMTLFMAGYETTATAMTWTWSLLSQHPVVVDRLRAELDRVLGGCADTADGAPDLGFEQLAQLTYTRAVVAESMRLFPPAYTVVRVCTQPTVLGGHRIEPGWSVATSAYLAHRDERWWDEPDEFRPERWVEPHRHPRSAYFPFGAGSRICIGEQFTWTETTLVLAILAHRWSPQLLGDRPVAPRGSITLRPRGPVLMRLSR